MTREFHNEHTGIFQVFPGASHARRPTPPQEEATALTWLCSTPLYRPFVHDRASVASSSPHPAFIVCSHRGMVLVRALSHHLCAIHSLTSCSWTERKLVLQKRPLSTDAEFTMTASSWKQKSAGRWEGSREPLSLSARTESLQSLQCYAVRNQFKSNKSPCCRT